MVTTGQIDADQLVIREHIVAKQMSADITVRLEDLPDKSGLGVWLQIGDQAWLIPLEAADWLSETLRRQVEELVRLR